MKLKAGAATGLIAALVLVAGMAGAQQSGSQQSDPAMQQSPSESGQQMSSGAMTKDPATVKKVQQALSSQGFDAGPADGKWGSKTQSALKKYQESKGMEASGNLDQETLASLGVSGAAAGGQGSAEEQSGAGGTSDDAMKDEQSGAGGTSDDAMKDQQSGAGGTSDDMKESQSSGGEQSGSKY